MNNHVCTVVLNTYQKIDMIGGQAAAVFLDPGTYTVYVESTSPYDPEQLDKSGWTSERVEVTVKAGETVAFSIEPKKDGPRKVGPWLLKKK